MISWIRYLPLGTSLICLLFFVTLINHARRRSWALHIVWWAFGVATYGLGTLIEGVIGIIGNTATLTKFWYILGAIWGAYPLAQGTVYLLLKKKTAHTLTLVSLPLVVLFSIFVLISPVKGEVLSSTLPTGKLLGWVWVRWLTPFVNLYAVFFLVGGAVWSAWRAWRKNDDKNRAIGNSLIALGALMPAIGGGFAKVGKIETLYLFEFVGILLIFAGYTFISRYATNLYNQLTK